MLRDNEAHDLAIEDEKYIVTLGLHKTFLAIMRRNKWEKSGGKRNVGSQPPT